LGKDPAALWPGFPLVAGKILVATFPRKMVSRRIIYPYRIEPIVAGKELVYQSHGEKEWLLSLRFGESVIIPIK